MAGVVVADGVALIEVPAVWWFNGTEPTVGRLVGSRRLGRIVRWLLAESTRLWWWTSGADLAGGQHSGAGAHLPSDATSIGGGNNNCVPPACIATNGPAR